MKDTALKIEYTLVLGMYWFLSAILSVFLIPLLKEQGIEMGRIGLLLGVRSVSGMLLQPVVAGFAQRNAKKLPLKVIVAALCLMGTVFTILHLILPMHFLIAAFIFAGYGITLSAPSTLIDAMSNQYTLSGRSVNYTLSRAFGSITWAFASLVLGSRINFDGHAEVILYIQIGALLLLGAMNLMLPTPEITGGEEGVKAAKPIGNHSIAYILKRYPEFTLILTVYVVVMFSHMINMTYLIEKIEALGGSTAQLGVSQFLLAIAEILVPLFYLKLKRKVGITKILSISITAVMLRVVITSMAVSITMIYIGQLFQAVVAMYYSGNVMYIGEKIDEEDQIKAQGILAAFQQCSGCIGSVAAAQLLGIMGVNGLFTAISMVAVFGVLLLYAGLALLSAKKRVSAYQN